MAQTEVVSQYEILPLMVRLEKVVDESVLAHDFIQIILQEENAIAAQKGGIKNAVVSKQFTQFEPIEELGRASHEGDVGKDALLIQWT